MAPLQGLGINLKCQAAIDKSYQIWYVYLMNGLKRLPARFFESANGRMPVRDWLLSLSESDRKAIGDDIRTAEFGWPIGMPLCRSITGKQGLWEIRSNLGDGRIGRVFFCVHDGHMALLHGFIKNLEERPQKNWQSLKNE
ncbi:type II toxin-antitoxin system RelE/ParE family toxin [Hoeflea ulvae]|uniref:Type II toxin-antitoxin system RelE/ParE family toxin n=1 Tax=Hoeflea ulvae TaxID=2983764 RepID=A0ABT3YEL5_9HYPH|nr:type II toxin-antitoxin system RelE/ParE family toxin [Hoeflea ulvae]MCY0094327.1 type II toxin-antitoxin system RelE/ParE family toxin [Hoeflea ulvae]